MGRSSVQWGLPVRKWSKSHPENNFLKKQRASGGSLPDHLLHDGRAVESEQTMRWECDLP